MQKKVLGMTNELLLVARNAFNINTRHTDHFSTKIEANSLSITYLTSDYNYRGFIRNLALPLHQVTTCNIRQTKTTDKRVMTGITTNAVFGLFGQTRPFQH